MLGIFSMLLVMLLFASLIFAVVSFCASIMARGISRLIEKNISSKLGSISSKDSKFSSSRVSSVWSFFILSPIFDLNFSLSRLAADAAVFCYGGFNFVYLDSFYFFCKFADKGFGWVNILSEIFPADYPRILFCLLKTQGGPQGGFGN